ncbi:hypothetical protein ACQEUU_33830 [Nonomuraea sp. CA-218870]|uniref:hypothetical protein n=1 Tax=Nonomuraea sp. CA-218870 TaxID=3239998 RepID=UPI003D93AEA3
MLDQLGTRFPSRLERIDLSCGDQPERQLTGGWWQTPVEGASPSLRRAVVRAVSRQERLFGYLWNAAVPMQDALCERDSRPGHETVTAYGGLRLRDVVHHVLIGGGPPREGGVADLQEVTFVSGGCHFSARTARVITESGRSLPVTGLRRGRVGEQIVGLRLDPELTVSEVDTAARLPAVGAGVLSRIPPGVPVRVLLDVPHAATALILLEAAQRGELSPRLLSQWCEAVDARHPTLVRLHAERWRAGSGLGARPMRVEVSAELDIVGAYLRHVLSCGRIPATDELVDVVTARDRFWRALVRIAPPVTPVELAELSYVAAQLRAAASTAESPRLAIAVENVHEAKIQRRSGLLARSLRAELPGTRFPLMGLYPLSRIWVRGTDGGVRLNLHTHDPGRWAVDEHGNTVDLIRLADDLYAGEASPLVSHG